MNPASAFVLRRGSNCTPLGEVDLPVVDEAEQIQFELVLPTAETSAGSWRVRLGDFLPEKAKGMDFGSLVRWERRAWFDSCRGKVQLSIERNADPDASEFADEGWLVAHRAAVLVCPSKITDAEWQAMLGDLQAVAVDLANDLVGKATGGLMGATAMRSAVDELVATRGLVERLGQAMQRITENPHSVLSASSERVTEPPRRLNALALKRLLTRGRDPRRLPTRASGRLARQRLRPSYDVPEHRQIKGTLQAAIRRIREGEERAKSEIAELEADRAWRERPDDLPGSSLYDRLDRPKISRLRSILAESAVLRARASRLAASPVLSDLPAKEELGFSLVWHYLPAYRLAWKAMLEWNTSGRLQIDTGEEVRRKETSRMYEEWVFLQLAGALRQLGFRIDSSEDVFRRIGRRRYLMDLPRGARLSFSDEKGIRVTLYFEPWIRPKEVATRLGDVFYHGRERNAAWCPDVLLAFENVPGLKLRAVVVDAKYTASLGEHNWAGVRKYLQIRRVSDGGQAVDQVWLSAPRVSGIRFEDDSVNWTVAGPDVPVGLGTIQGEVGLTPNPGSRPGEPTAQVVSFLKGILAHGQVTASETF